jgi:hypothetical protein
MTNEIVNIGFTDSAEQEVAQLVNDIQLQEAFDALKSNGSIDPKLKKQMLGLVALFAELFSAKLPEVVDGDVATTLRVASRDINLSRLLRERGLFRIYRLTEMTREDGTPIYVGMNNPLTGEPFTRMEDLIGYFCEASHVSRSLVFQRLATIKRCQYVGMDLEKTFKTIIAKPYAISETLRTLGKWNGAELVEMEPEVADRLMEKYGENIEDVPLLPDGRKDYTEDQIKGAIASLLEEVAEHERVKDVLDYVRHDILKKPEISYRWDDEADALIVELVKKELDDNGTEFIVDVLAIPFYPDITSRLPEEIRQDLIKRLPIVNRAELD